MTDYAMEGFAVGQDFTDERSPAASIFTCSLCDKPYTSEASRNRHLKYCKTSIYHRPRSCRACNSAKSKCSFESPCSRCTKKGINCVYESRRDKRTVSLSSDYVRGSPPRIVSEGITDFENPSSAYDLPMDPFQLQMMDEPGWDLSEPGFPKLFTDSFAAEGLLEFNNHIQPQTQNLSTREKFGPEPGLWCKWASYGLSLAVVTESSTVKESSNSSGVLPKIQPPADRTADIIIQTLRAFPTMMLRRETFPWFIHRQSHLLSKSRIALPEALSACMSIAQMFASKTPETDKFLWKSIMSECRRLMNEMREMSKYELLAALQACMIYLVICIVDHSPENEGHGLELLQVLYDIFIHFKTRFDGNGSQSGLSSSSSEWENWIFAESRRRLQNLWLLVGCVVCVKTGNPCDTSESYRGVPLPSPKSLWEAPTQSIWEMECDAGRLLQLNGLETLGNLIDAQRSNYSPSNARKLDLWNASVDNLGLLLNLIATMV